MHNASRAHYKFLSELLIFKAWKSGAADGDDDAETNLLNRTLWQGPGSYDANLYV